MTFAALALLTAIAIKVEGTVTVPPGVRLLKTHTQVRDGETIHLPKQARVVLLCSTDRWVSAAGPRTWRVNGNTCKAGRRVAAGTYRELAAENGRIRSLQTGLAIEIQTRADEEEDLVPILLAPRNSAVTDPRPAVSWTRVPHATEYRIEWLGESTSTTRIAADDAPCNGAICTAPYPADRPPLTAGTPAFVSVACRLGIASPWRQEKYAGEVRLLEPRAQDALRRRLAAIDALPADESVRSLLAAGAYAGGGVLHEAWQRYTQSVEPAAWVTAGDLALEMDLPAMAARDYTRAAEAAAAGPVRAAAAFGLGRVALARRQYVEAQLHFELAQRIFASLHLTGDEAAARAGLARATQMLKRMSP